MKQLIKEMSLIFLMISMSSICYSQNDCQYLKFVLLVDNEVPSPSYISDMQLLYKPDIASELIDTIGIVYNVGSLSFTNTNYSKFLQIDSTRTVTFKFKYTSPGPKYNVITYEYNFECWMLDYGFMIFKVFNFSNKKNWKEFPLRKGYGVEYQASDRYSVLPRKK